jgi:hypothetical protein
MRKFTMPPGRVRGIVLFLLLLAVPYIFIIAYFAISGSRSRSGGQSPRQRERLSTSEDYAQFEYPVAKADECGPVASRGNAVLKWIQLLGAQVILLKNFKIFVFPLCSLSVRLSRPASFFLFLSFSRCLFLSSSLLPSLPPSLPPSLSIPISGNFMQNRCTATWQSVAFQILKTNVKWWRQRQLQMEPSCSLFPQICTCQ